MDPFAALPRELALRCMSFLDAMSLGRAAQVSKSWKALADDDLLWRIMCEQHIERKCEKCGWGLPLLEKKRRQKSPAAAAGASASMAQAQAKYDNATHNHTPLPKTLEEALSPANMSVNSTKRSRLERNASSSANFEALNHNSPVQSSFSTLPQNNSTSAAPASLSSASGSALQRQQTPTIFPQITRPWKSVYCERLAIARNWARGNCKFRVLTGHTDAITCLQIDETLSNPPYPVLMTGSWDRTVRIWNAESGQCVSILRGHTRGVRCLQFDSVKLITGGMDAKIKLWNWKTGKCLRTLEGHRDSVISLCFDKQVLASGSSDSTIKVSMMFLPFVYA
jgi:F-box/WD-40 domain protein MET30